MNRLSALVAKFEEETSDSGFDTTYTRNRADKAYAPNGQASDCESISEGSRKIRKKRETYHKISDEIRVKLLEAVQNGETLKSVAKLYKINYSSAKSILHTYRKEGRILKKAATERTTKKKVVACEDSEPAQPLTKSLKKENAKAGQNNKKVVAPLAERITTTTTCASQNEEGSPSHLNNGLSDNLVSILKMEHYANQQEDNQALTRPSMLHTNYLNMDQQDYNHPLESISRNRTPRQKGGKLFDNFFANYSEFQFPEVGGDFNGNEMPDYANNMYQSNEFDPFSDMMGALQPRGQKNEEVFQDTNSFFYPKGFNNGYNFEEKGVKAEVGGTYEENLENAGNPLKSFMDTQKLFQDAFRKANFLGSNGNQGFRKNSFDLF